MATRSWKRDATFIRVFGEGDYAEKAYEYLYKGLVKVEIRVPKKGRNSYRVYLGCNSTTFTSWKEVVSILPKEYKKALLQIERTKEYKKQKLKQIRLHRFKKRVYSKIITKQSLEGLSQRETTLILKDLAAYKEQLAWNQINSGYNPKVGNMIFG